MSFNSACKYPTTLAFIKKNLKLVIHNKILKFIVDKQTEAIKYDRRNVKRPTVQKAREQARFYLLNVLIFFHLRHIIS